MALPYDRDNGEFKADLRGKHGSNAIRLNVRN